MISIFNRKELLATFDLKRKSNICDKLDGDNIDYHIKVINRNSPSAFSDGRGRVGTLGQNLELSYEYIIYVKKKDYERARLSIGIN